MQVVDLGHSYALDQLDGKSVELLTFVKREGPNYPGNVGAYPGTILQEVFRACIDRLRYVDDQIHDDRNETVINHLQESILLLEQRAAERHGKQLDWIEGIPADKQPVKSDGHLNWI